MGRIFQNDVGVRLEIDTGVDLSTATVKKLTVKKPDGSLVEWTNTTTSGTKIIYVSEVGDFSMTGKHHVAAYVEFPSSKHTGETFIIQVYTRFDL